MTVRAIISVALIYGGPILVGIGTGSWLIGAGLIIMTMGWSAILTEHQDRDHESD